METDLTKRIKLLTHHYNPKMPSKMRTVRWADEVWTPTGIVDSIRFEDYKNGEEYLCPYLNPDRFDKSRVEIAKKLHPEIEPGHCFRDNSLESDPDRCRGCVFRSHVYTVGMMITCFEVKITLSDFKSKNGHNFHGNENYYCVPKSLIPSIENLVPENIGILSYFCTEKIDGLKMYKPAVWQDVKEEDKVLLLYNAMKKWCDGAVFI